MKVESTNNSSYKEAHKTKEGQLARAENSLAKEEAESSTAFWDVGAKVISGVLGGLLGGRRRSSSSSTVSSAGRAYKQRRDVSIAKDKIKDIEKLIAELEAELVEEINEIEADLDPATIKLETESIKPYKKDIEIQAAALLWLPFDERGEKAW
ncbi:MAG: hypothetical protein ACPG32_14555 [Akkermansiaceae bacterium]